MLQVGAASAVDSETNGVDAQVSVGAQADVLAQCAWWLDGVDTSLSLGSELNAPYVGDALAISAEDESVSLYFSGGEAADTACGIYVDGSAGIDLTVELAELAFVGSPDTSMNFDLDANNPLLVQMAVNGSSVSCSTDGVWDDYSSASPVVVDTATTPETVFGITDGSVRDPIEFDPPAGSLPNCDLSMTYSTEIPQGLIPDSSGTYTFVGPAMTVTIVNATAP
jgi:hypothetical protein